jgi:hypothetical protein
MASTYDFSFVAGDSIDETITPKNSDGSAFDLTDYSLRGQMRKSFSSPTKIDFSLSLNDDKDAILWSLSPEVSKDIVPGDYVYQIEIYKLNSEGAQGHQDEVLENITLLMGAITVLPEVSR